MVSMWSSQRTSSRRGISIRKWRRSWLSSSKRSRRSFMYQRWGISSSHDLVRRRSVLNKCSRMRSPSMSDWWLSRMRHTMMGRDTPVSNTTFMLRTQLSLTLWWPCQNWIHDSTWHQEACRATTHQEWKWWNSSETSIWTCSRCTLTVLRIRSSRLTLHAARIRRKVALTGARVMISLSHTITRMPHTIGQRQAIVRRPNECWIQASNRVRPYVSRQIKPCPIHSTMLHSLRTVVIWVAYLQHDQSPIDPHHDTQRTLRSDTRTWLVSSLRTYLRPCQMLRKVIPKMYLHHSVRTQDARSARRSDKGRVQQLSHHPIKC